MQLGGIHHIAILTPDLAALEAFYTQTLGLPVARRWDTAGIVFVDGGGVWLELTRLDAPAGHAGPHALDHGIGINHLAFRVRDIDITYGELVRRGVRSIAAPQTFEELRVAFLADPDGNVIELIEDGDLLLARTDL
jgi:glyoxylase I family protein